MFKYFVGDEMHVHKQYPKLLTPYVLKHDNAPNVKQKGPQQIDVCSHQPRVALSTKHTHILAMPFPYFQGQKPGLPPVSRYHTCQAGKRNSGSLCPSETCRLFRLWTCPQQLCFDGQPAAQ